MRYCLSIIFFIIPELSLINAQDNRNSISTIEEEILEPLNENSDEETDATNYLEQLKFYRENPLDLNSAKKEDFEKLQILTPFQIYSIIEYREKQGSFLSVNELNGVAGISKETFNLIKPFIKISNESMENRKPQVFNQTLLINSGKTLEKQNGYLRNDSLYNCYEGSPLKLKTKYRIEKGEFFTAGLTCEKDAGEAIFSKSNKTFDFISGYLQFKETKFLKKLVIGDFTANFGQGLVVWNGFASGRSSLTVNVRKVKDDFDKYSSYDENRFFRGIAVTKGVKHFDFSAFFSTKKIDANVITRNISGEVTQVSSIQTTGYHSTLNDITNEDAIGEIASGLNATFDKGRFRFGASLFHINYSADIAKSDELYKKYTFSGNNLTCGSLNYLFRFRKFEFFGEAARNAQKGNAILNGLAIEIVPEFSISFVQRYFEKTYNSPYANVLAQNNKASNESGFYSGFEFSPFNGFKINAYCDFFKFPFPKYSASSPSSGVNYLSDFKFDVFENVSFSFKYTYSKKQEDGSLLLSNIPILEDKISKKLRFMISYKVSSNFELRNRAELAYYEKEKTKQNGYMLLQDFIWRPEIIKLVFSARYAVFETESYENSIYVYENDVLFSYSVPALYGKGTRLYAMMKYNFKKLNFWLRYGATYYADKQVISSGLNEISGNKKSDITLQLILDF